MSGTLAEVPAEELEELVEDLSDLRHDLGKYIGFETGFLGADAAEELRLPAMRKDLLETYRYRGEVQSCWQVWARLRPEALAREPEVQAIDEALELLQGLATRLDEAGQYELARAQQRRVGELSRALLERARALLSDDEDDDDWGP